MPPKLDMIGMVVQDMARTLAFYRQLGLDIPDGADSEPHVEATLPNGLRVGWDTVATIRRGLVQNLLPGVGRYAHPPGVPIRFAGRG